MASAAIAMAIAVAASAALAQKGGEAGMSGCPDGTKDGIMSNTTSPTPGGGCDNTVYKSNDKADDYISGKRGVRPSAKPSPKSEDETSPATKRKEK